MEDESADEPERPARTLIISPSASNIVNHMVSSSSDSSLGRRQAAILANFGPRNSRLEWVCAKNYAKFSNGRLRKHSPARSDSHKESKCGNCDCCANRCGCSGSVSGSCSGSETEDEEHEAITPASATIPLPDMFGKKLGKLTPVMFWGSQCGSNCSTPTSEMSHMEIEAAQTLLALATRP